MSSGIKLILTKELFDFIHNECELFIERTWPANDVDVQDVLYSFFYSTEDKFCVLEDWDEGERSFLG